MDWFPRKLAFLSKQDIPGLMPSGICDVFTFQSYIYIYNLNTIINVFIIYSLIYTYLKNDKLEKKTMNVPLVAIVMNYPYFDNRKFWKNGYFRMAMYNYTLTVFITSRYLLVSLYMFYNISKYKTCSLL